MATTRCLGAVYLCALWVLGPWASEVAAVRSSEADDVMGLPMATLVEDLWQEPQHEADASAHRVPSNAEALEKAASALSAAAAALAAQPAAAAALAQAAAAPALAALPPAPAAGPSLASAAFPAQASALLGAAETAPRAVVQPQPPAASPVRVPIERLGAAPELAPAAVPAAAALPGTPGSSLLEEGSRREKEAARKGGTKTKAPKKDATELTMNDVTVGDIVQLHDDFGIILRGLPELDKVDVEKACKHEEVNLSLEQCRQAFQLAGLKAQVISLDTAAGTVTCFFPELAGEEGKSVGLPPRLFDSASERLELRKMTAADLQEDLVDFNSGRLLDEDHRFIQELGGDNFSFEVLTQILADLAEGAEDAPVVALISDMGPHAWREAAKAAVVAGGGSANFKPKPDVKPEAQVVQVTGAKEGLIKARHLPMFLLCAGVFLVCILLFAYNTLRAESAGAQYRRNDGLTVDSMVHATSNSGPTIALRTSSFFKEPLHEGGSFVGSSADFVHDPTAIRSR